MDHVFDAEDFLQSLDGDKELALELLRAYMEDSPIRLGQLRHALEAKDLDMLIQIGHSLKGMSGVVRAEKVVELALLMEIKARAGHVAECVRTVDALDAALAATIKDMRSFS